MRDNAAVAGFAADRGARAREPGFSATSADPTPHPRSCPPAHPPSDVVQARRGSRPPECRTSPTRSRRAARSSSPHPRSPSPASRETGTGRSCSGRRRSAAASINEGIRSPTSFEKPPRFRGSVVRPRPTSPDTDHPRSSGAAIHHPRRWRDRSSSRRCSRSRMVARADALSRSVTRSGHRLPYTDHRRSTRAEARHPSAGRCRDGRPNQADRSHTDVCGLSWFEKPPRFRGSITRTRPWFLDTDHRRSSRTGAARHPIRRRWSPA